MLSRVAERLYWIARNLERAEVTARLCGAYSHLILDIPKGSVLGWDTLIKTIDGDAAFNKHYKHSSERNVIKFMLADTDNIGSVRSSVMAARANVRTTRDVLPEDIWELVNEFYLHVDECAEKSVSRSNRFRFLEEVVTRSQQLNGLIESAVSRDHAYNFLKIGRSIERADMVSRTVDSAAAVLLKEDSEEVPDLTLVWTSVLKALSASAAYRREFGPLVEANEVVDFLFKNEVFPRSILFSARSIAEVVKSLKNQQKVTDVLDSVIVKIEKFDVTKHSYAQLHDFIDRLQEQLIHLDHSIINTWFKLQHK